MEAGESAIQQALASANGVHSNWSESGGEMRAEALDKYAELLEQNRAQAMAMCIREAGKTIPDALAEVREAVHLVAPPL